MADMGDDEAVFFDRKEDAVFPIIFAVEKLADLEINQTEAGFRCVGIAQGQLRQGFDGVDQSLILLHRGGFVRRGNPEKGFLDVPFSFGGKDGLGGLRH